MNKKQDALSNTHSTLQSAGGSSMGWLSTEALDDLLLEAILENSRWFTEDEEIDFEEIDDYFSENDLETEEEYRRSGLRLLATVAPLMADLLGGPPVAT